MKKYTELLTMKFCRIWLGFYSVVMSKWSTFVWLQLAVGRLKPQFSGAQQEQDSHQLMEFVLNGLHEDLNRIHKKPDIKQTYTEGRLDEVETYSIATQYLSSELDDIWILRHNPLDSIPLGQNPPRTKSTQTISPVRKQQ